MAMKLWLFTLFISFSSSLLPVLSSSESGDINWWCSKTPHPEPCKFYMSQAPNISATLQKYEFRNMAIKVAMEQAVDALNHTQSLGTKCVNKREKMAMEDCLPLYESTILQLNQTLDNRTNHTDFDAQTWLSAALTNIDTCQTGFIELGGATTILPLMSNNVSKLISNTLAIKNASTEEQSDEDGFSSWVSSGDQSLLQLASPPPSLVVAQDGSGNYHTIKEALAASLNRSDSGRFVIYVRSGVYNEYIQINGNMKNIMLIGAGFNNTIITGNRSDGGGYSILASATVTVLGDGFIAHGIMFRNTAGPQNGQAVALLSRSDRSVFDNCGFQGYQDTLFVHSQRQFYQQCHIFGTVDFIFGNAAVVLQKCTIYARKPIPGGGIVITAQGRIDANQSTGILIHNSRIVAALDLVPMLGTIKAYLGRPWKQYSRTVYLQSFLDSLVHPAGWMRMGSETKFSTLYFAEYENYGPGASTRERVKWPGYQVITNKTVAETFTVENFIDGKSWLPQTGVPFTAGLLP